ncbi:MAG: hypothetical protein HQK52_05650 [Oligoflexia bacterium]|nr:hypothetical protein [Oligoflexia bacterium]
MKAQQLQWQKKVLEIFHKNFSSPNDYKRQLQTNRKQDNTLVTSIDLEISKMFEEDCSNNSSFNGKNYFFLSEENFSALSAKQINFPALILDPIDGTRELAEGIPECALSCAILNTPELADKSAWAWIFNPFTGFNLSSEELFCPPIKHFEHDFLGLVSRSEWQKGLFDRCKIKERATLSPRGSIAFKLGLLAAGSADFVLSYQPKKLWDIAAGTFLCTQRGISFYEQGVRVHSLDRLHYSPPLVWCREDLLYLFD